MKTSLLTAGIIALACVAMPALANGVSICDGVAGNLVQNCGFENGAFTDWTLTNPDGGGAADVNTLVEANSFSPPGGNSGLFYALLGDNLADPTTISQTFSDAAGSTLTFSFYLSTDGYSSEIFQAEFNGNVLYSLPSGPAQGYTLYSYSVTGTGSDTISFVEQDVNPTGNMGLDDVSVVDPVATPEPSSLVFLAGALSAIVWKRYRRS
ncbi:MAG TPA: hypothetical protein VMH05_14725 [Bryobacteraceae bacterium]|nr:hypothetical protein [Bryobacteraceae bacterium]